MGSAIFLFLSVGFSYLLVLVITKIITIFEN